MCAGSTRKHHKRDLELPRLRDLLLKNALEDLMSDPDVLGIYQGGSLAKGNADNYSDIDLHIIVSTELLPNFIKEKKERAAKWGKVLFYEGREATPVIVTHYDCFVKVDSWYHSPDDLTPSLWLKGIKAHYDPNGLIEPIILQSAQIDYAFSEEEVLFWRNKVLAFIHETYRAVMRAEFYYAAANLDNVRRLMVSGWYMEMEQHLDTSYDSWSKIEGQRTRLQERQHQLLEGWRTGTQLENVMQTLKAIVPEFQRLNKTLCEKMGIPTEESHIQSIISKVF